MKKIIWLLITLIAMSGVSVKAKELEPYKLDAFFGGYCYTEESFLANDFKEVETVNIGDKIVCGDVGFETYVTDKVKSFKYTLVYGSGLKLIKADTHFLKENVENTYSHELEEATSVGEDLGHFTFEVVGTNDLQYGIKNIEFTTMEDKTYSSADSIKNLKFLWDDEKITFSKYKEKAFNMNNCYTEESVKANNFKKVESVNTGDKIVCEASFETHTEDKVKSLKYTLVYGSGLKLIKADIDSLPNKTENTYSIVFDKATSVGDNIGMFTFEVTGTKDLQYGIKDIRFITEDKKTYSSDDITNTLKLNSVNNPKTNDLNVFLLVTGLVTFLGISLVSYKKLKSY